MWVLATEDRAPAAFPRDFPGQLAGAGVCENPITMLPALASRPAGDGEYKLLRHPFLPLSACALPCWAPEELVVTFVVTQQFYEGP